MLLNKQIDRQECIVVSHLKSTAYRNKFLTILDIEHLNARKCEWCAETFYLYFEYFIL